MRRLLFVAVIVGLASPLPAVAATNLRNSARVNPALSCSSPTKLTDYQGTLSFPPYVVQQDVWSPRNGTKQTMWVCNEHDWKATVNQTGVASDGVATYPDSQFNWTDWWHCASQPPLSSFTSLKMSYSATSPAAGAYDMTADVFLDNFCGEPLIEVMVLNRYRGISFPASQTVTIGKVAYYWYHSGSLIQFRRVNQTDAGTVNLLRILRWLERKGLVKPTSTLQFAAFGAEVLTTFGQDLTFTVDGFSVAEAHA